MNVCDSLSPLYHGLKLFGFSPHIKTENKTVEMIKKVQMILVILTEIIAAILFFSFTITYLLKNQFLLVNIIKYEKSHSKYFLPCY